ncbi:MAG: hypothetical protein HYW07_06225 [Candidatus Latescibacteria bacterium]|nr:hypothetical protein [Candidatus Latescibacterota bacterium]
MKETDLQTQPARRWDFTMSGDIEGWKASSSISAVVMGGALWLKLLPPITDPERLRSSQYQTNGPHHFGYHDQEYDLESPPALGIPANAVKKVRMRIMNLSPVTDAYVFWCAAGQTDFAGAARFTLKADLKEWQEVICHVDDKWGRTIDQIVIRFPFSTPRGDIWIDWLEISDGPQRVPPPRPDLCSDRVVPRIKVPGISQADFREAFKVLDECLVTDVPVYGFPYPVIRPGGGYGVGIYEDWWEIDSSLALAGAKWVNQGFAEDVMRGFGVVQAQNPDGRIDPFGRSAFRGQVGEVSQFPVFFEAAYDVARRTSDQRFSQEIYLTMKRYLDWWLSPVKRDSGTGLVTGVHEETFGEPFDVAIDGLSQTIAPVDDNVHVALGCSLTARIGHYLAAEFKLGEYEKEAQAYDKVFEEIKEAINTYLWSEEDGAYYNFNVKERTQRRRLICSTFEPMRLRMAPPDKVERLLSRLLDPALFNWGKLPMTTLAKTEKDYKEATDEDNGRSWFAGDVWTIRNLPIIAGLEDSGRHDLAAELAWTTVKAFNHNYCELLVPSTGEGHGVRRYAFSASQYIQAIIEHVFGVDYDQMRRTLRVVPRIPVELKGQDLSLCDLMLPSSSGSRLALEMRHGRDGETRIAIEITGQLPEGNLEVLMPRNGRKLQEVVDDQRQALPLIWEAEGLTGVAGVRLPMRSSIRLVFR